MFRAEQAARSRPFTLCQVIAGTGRQDFRARTEMAQRNRWISVCHSTAQHAASGLCHVQARLSEALRTGKKTAASIDLLGHGPRPCVLSRRYHLDLAISSLKQRFMEIVHADGLDPADLAEAKLLFEFDADAEPYTGVVHSKLVHRDGRQFVRAVNFLGAQFSARSDH